MLSNDPTEPTLPASTKADSPAPLDPRSPIEVASGGDGTVNDPAGRDKPPGVDDLERFA
jgi:hypothetical protein